MLLLEFESITNYEPHSYGENTCFIKNINENVTILFSKLVYLTKLESFFFFFSLCLVNINEFKMPQWRRWQKHHSKCDCAFYETSVGLSQLPHFVQCSQTFLELILKKAIQV